MDISAEDLELHGPTAENLDTLEDESIETDDTEIAMIERVAHEIIREAQRRAIQPTAVLELFDSCIIYNKGDVSINVSPDQLVHLMSDFIPEQVYESGLLSEDIIQVGKKDSKYLTVSYRPPQITGIWIEGLPNAIHVPMPGLVLLRKHRQQSNDSYSDSSSYAVIAVTERPRPDSLIYVAPLPNVNHNSICWGNVQKTKISPDSPHNMTEDWKSLLGSAFSNHGASNKSRSYQGDVRILLNQLSESKATEYPKDELLMIEASAPQKKNQKPKGMTYAQWIDRVS